MNLRNARYLPQDSSIVLLMVDTFPHYKLFDLTDLLKVQNIQRMHQHTKSVQSMVDMYLRCKLMNSLFPDMAHSIRPKNQYNPMLVSNLSLDCMCLTSMLSEKIGLVDLHNAPQMLIYSLTDQWMVDRFLSGMRFDLIERSIERNDQRRQGCMPTDQIVAGRNQWHTGIDLIDHFEIQSGLGTNCCSLLMHAFLGRCPPRTRFD